MIISRTPFRISFFGGGTDYPAWYEMHGGAVLSTSIDKYTYINCRWLPPFFDHKHRITYSKVEDVKTADEIAHPAVRAVLKNYETDCGIEIHCDADLPARSGLGSSSSFLVGLLHTLEALCGRRVTPSWLAEKAIYYERTVLQEHVGSQDQIAAAFGGLNIISFGVGGGYSIKPLVIPEGRKAELNSRLMLFFTGWARDASTIAKSQVDSIARNSSHLFKMRELVDEAATLLASKSDLDDFGKMLAETWLLKRALSAKISTDAIDAIYKTACDAGALGGKLLGAGGGGFILFYVLPEKQAAVRKALSKLIHVPFNFESEGSNIIYYRGDISASL